MTNKSKNCNLQKVAHQSFPYCFVFQYSYKTVAAQRRQLHFLSDKERCKLL